MPEHQRQFRAHDRQVSPQLRGQIGRRLYVVQIQRHALHIVRDSAVPRRAPDFLDRRALRELPYNRVLAPTTADDQYFHVRLRSFERIKHDTAAPPPLSTDDWQS